MRKQPGLEGDRAINVRPRDSSVTAANATRCSALTKALRDCFYLLSAMQRQHQGRREWPSLGAPSVKNPTSIQETWVPSLGLGRSPG